MSKLSWNLQNLAISQEVYRRSGRTTGMLSGAPHNSYIIGANVSHAKILEETARSIGRNDLKAVSIDQILGLKGPFVIDHFALSKFFSEAASEISKLEDELEKKDEEITDLKKKSIELKLNLKFNETHDKTLENIILGFFK